LIPEHLRFRQSLGHYKGDVLAFDPHRIRTYSRRIMSQKKSRPNERSCPVLQTFFSLDVHTGQPLGFTIGSSGRTATGASLELLEMMDMILPSNNELLLADTEHESCRLIGQRSGEKEEEYNYKSFIATGNKFSLELITEDYPE
jgi:hypothetical protein